ncbi:hypothetical protein J6590_043290 [Homalodisca vitripennis]|nr:hypothetical protein J6590_043290 [Homalodisca vitripennis]
MFDHLADDDSPPRSLKQEEDAEDILPRASLTRSRTGVESIMVGPEPSCGIAFSNSKALVKDWEKRIRNINWSRASGLRLSKMFISPYANGWAALLDQRNILLGWALARLTNVYSVEESAEHIWLNCPAISKIRKRFLGAYLLSPKDIREQESSNLIGFCKSLEL